MADAYTGNGRTHRDPVTEQARFRALIVRFRITAWSISRASWFTAARMRSVATP